ncbi:MAG: intracellular septation protein A [Rhodobacteraceae bacterium]|nr:intracellular septation protein A [Paracoccaceae bacterium]|tara:strand:- start:1673 stop:2275 length:603 start_codon:yes stop_codon:yes gene_type:complete
MKNKEENSLTKSILEFVPLITFFLAYYYFPNSNNLTGEDLSVEKIIFATKVFVPVLLVASVLSYLILRTISKMSVITALLVIFFGALTIWFRDPTFIKMKPTIIYLSFAIILIAGLIRNRSLLKSLMGSTLVLEERGWVLLTKRIIIFFICLAFLNELVWRFFGQDQWVNFKTFGMPILSLLFFAFQYRLFQKYLVDKEN